MRQDKTQICIDSNLHYKFKVFSAENNLKMKGITEDLIRQFMESYTPTSESIEKTVSNLNNKSSEARPS